MDPGHRRESLSSPSQSFSTADKSASKSDTSMCTRFALSGTIRSFRSRSRRWCDSPQGINVKAYLPLANHSADKSASKSDTSMCTRFALSGTIRSFRSRSRRWCDSPRLSLALYLECVAVIVVTVDFGVLSAFLVATPVFLCASLVVRPDDTVPAIWRAVLAEGVLRRRPLAIIDLEPSTRLRVLRTMG